MPKPPPPSSSERAGLIAAGAYLDGSGKCRYAVPLFILKMLEVWGVLLVISISQLPYGVAILLLTQLFRFVAQHPEHSAMYASRQWCLLGTGTR